MSLVILFNETTIASFLPYSNPPTSLISSKIVQLVSMAAALPQQIEVTIPEYKINIEDFAKDLAFYQKQMTKRGCVSFGPKQNI